MTVILTLPVSGRSKRDLVEMAHELCGQAGYDFELNPGEVSSALRALEVMMAEHPFNLMGFAFGMTEELSGLAEIDVAAVYTQLALRIASGKGKMLAPSAGAMIGKAYGDACSRYLVMPAALIAQNTPRGAGHRGAAAFISEVPDE